MQTDCSTRSVLSTSVTILYAVIYSCVFFAASVYSFNNLKKYDKKFVKSSSIWFHDVWRRRRCYIPIIVHILDQITDISVAIQFYILAQRQTNDTSGINLQSCGGLNMWYLFILTIISMLLYRLVSSYLIYQSTKLIRRFFSQLLDLELFRALYINYLCNKIEPCNPQRWITKLEASLESSPQSLIQIIYLVKTGTFNSSYLVVISLISSLWSIVSNLISDDKVTVVEKARNANFKFKKTSICDTLILLFILPIFLSLCVICGCIYLVLWVLCYPCRHDHIFYRIKETFNDLWEHSKWIPLLYVTRIIWRIFDVTSHLLLMTLIWIIIGGTALIVKVVFEATVLLVLCIITKQWEILFAVIALIISTITDQLKKISIIIAVYRTCTNITFMILISIWLYRCTDFQERQSMLDDVYVFTIFIYSWIAVILSPICLLFLILQNAFKINTSTSHQLEKMIISNNYDGILEIQLYCSKYDIYDAQNKKTLLMLAIQQHNPSIVSYLLNQINEYDQKDNNGQNILDYYCKLDYMEDYTQKMKNILFEIFNKHPNIRTVKGFTIFLLACIDGDLEFIYRLIEMDANVVNDKINHNINGATLAKMVGCENVVNYLAERHNIHCTINGIGNVLDFLIEHDIVTPIALMNVYTTNPKIKSEKRYYTLFLTACYYGYLQVVKQLVLLDNTVLKDTALGSNGIDIAQDQKHTNIVQYLTETHYIISSRDKCMKIGVFGIAGSGKSTVITQIENVYVGSHNKNQYSKNDIDAIEFYINVDPTSNNEWMFVLFDIGWQCPIENWLQCVVDHNIQTMIYVMSLASYDQSMDDGRMMMCVMGYVREMQNILYGKIIPLVVYDLINRYCAKNCYVEALDVFETASKQEELQTCDIIVFLNKNELFVQKIKEISFSVFDSNFNKDLVHDINAIKDYLRHEFKKRFYDGIKPEKSARRIHFHVTCASDTNQMQTVMHLVQFEIVRKMMRIGMLM